MTAGLEGGEWSRLGRTLPPGKTRYPFYRRLGGPQGRSGRGRGRDFPPVQTGGKSRPQRDSIPDRPARSQSPYRLIYLAHIYIYIYEDTMKSMTQLTSRHATWFCPLESGYTVAIKSIWKQTFQTRHKRFMYFTTVVIRSVIFSFLETSWPMQVAHAFRKIERCGSKATLKKVVRLGSYLRSGTQQAA